MMTHDEENKAKKSRPTVNLTDDVHFRLEELRLVLRRGNPGRLTQNSVIEFLLDQHQRANRAPQSLPSPALVSKSEQALPHGDEILRKLGEVYWTSPEHIRMMLAGLLDVEATWWEELRPAAEKKRKAK
jgi:hypothetical protein